MATPADLIVYHGVDAQPINNKRRRRKSIVWEHFTVETIDAECTRASCNQCKKSFAYITGSKVAGTSHLKRHISLGICPVSRRNQERNQSSPCTPVSKNEGSRAATEPPRKHYRNSNGVASVTFNQDRSRYDIAKMMIMHEYPLHMVEHRAFIDFVLSLQPQFNMVSLETIRGDCIGVYQREKQRLLNLLGGIPGHVSLTLDLWTTDQTIGYALITGHFVDNDWKLHRRILDVVMLPFPDSESAFNHAIVNCITNWNFDSKLFTLTLDESFANEAVRKNLRGLLSIKNPPVLSGQLLIPNCYARVLTRIAQDALRSMSDTIQKVRDSVKYVKTLEAHEEKFTDLKQQLQVPSTKSLVLDNQRQWNSTYHMLVAATELREVFSCLDTSDPNYKETPSMDEWKQVEILCVYLKLLFDAANILTAQTYPTANTFFHELWKIQLKLTHAAMSEDIFICSLTRPMQEKFDKYWKDCSLVFAIAVVMDPRFKMMLVEFSFSRIYGNDAESWIRTVDEGVHELFFQYLAPTLPNPIFLVDGNSYIPKTEFPEEGGFHCNGIPKMEFPGEGGFLCNGTPKTEMPHEEETHLITDNGFLDFDVYIMSNQQPKSELDQYLEESLLPRTQDFDVLGWWKVNRQKYPTLSKMASDILCIPVSTVGPDSVFDIASKKMDGYRSSLKPSTLEALICAKDWLQYGSSYPLSVFTDPSSHQNVKMNGILLATHLS